MKKAVQIFVLVTLVVWFGCKKQEKNSGYIVNEKAAYIDSLVTVAFNEQYNNVKVTDSLAEVVYLLSEKQHYNRGVAQSLFLRSSVQQQHGYYDSAIQLAEQSLEIFKKIKDTVGIARLYNELGINYDFKAYYARAIDNYLKALTLFEQLKDIKGQANAYNNIGLIHQNQFNHREASVNYQKALALAEKIEYEDGVAQSLNNIGSNYIELTNFDSALRYFKRVLEIDLESGNTSYISYSYNNIGEAYMGLGDLDNALLYFEKSRKLKEELGNQRALANTIKNIGEAYLRRKEYNVAQEYLQKAAALAESLDLPEIRKDANELMHQLYIQLGDYKQALDYYKKYEQLKDDIGYDKKQAKISTLEKDFEIEKARRQINDAEYEARTSRLMRLVYVIIITLLLVLITALWIGLRQKQKTGRAMFTYQKELEEKNRELNEKNTEVERQKKEVEAALAVRSRFLSFMSHEIRTPLNGITGLVDLLETQPMLPEQTEFISALKRSADNLMLMLNNVLDLSKLEMGKITLENIEVDVHKILTDHVTLYKANALLRENTIEADVDINLPPKLQGDPYRVTQILSNLINNAIKFTRQGKIFVRCTLLDMREEKARLLFEVIDTGIGIAENQQAGIMEPFSQAESYTTRKYGGTGLGLSISARLLQAMNSGLKVQSRLGEGSRFYFVLEMPLYKAPVFNHPANYKAAPQVGLEGIHILVVEDNATNILLLTKLLAIWKTEYDVAENGIRALELIQQKKYDIILMDLHLPGLSGYEAAEKIKTGDNINHATPILAITAADDAEVKAHPLRRYLDDVMYKPISHEDLANRIKSFISKS